MLPGAAAQDTAKLVSVTSLVTKSLGEPSSVNEGRGKALVTELNIRSTTALCLSTWRISSVFSLIWVAPMHKNVTKMVQLVQKGLREQVVLISNVGLLRFEEVGETEKKKQEKKTAINHEKSLICLYFNPSGSVWTTWFSPFTIRECWKNLCETNHKSHILSASPGCALFSIETDETQSTKVCLLLLQMFHSPFSSSLTFYRARTNPQNQSFVIGGQHMLGLEGYPSKLHLPHEGPLPHITSHTSTPNQPPASWSWIKA